MPKVTSSSAEQALLIYQELQKRPELLEELYLLMRNEAVQYVNIKGCVCFQHTGQPVYSFSTEEDTAIVQHSRTKKKTLFPYGNLEDELTALVEISDDFLPPNLLLPWKRNAEGTIWKRFIATDQTTIVLAMQWNITTNVADLYFPECITFSPPPNWRTPAVLHRLLDRCLECETPCFVL